MALRTLSLVLPEETVSAIEAKIALGRYPDAETMIQDALESLETEEQFSLDAVEQFSDEFLRREVIPALDALEANPSSGYTLEQIREGIDEQENRHFRKAG